MTGAKLTPVKRLELLDRPPPHLENALLGRPLERHSQVVNAHLQVNMHEDITAGLSSLLHASALTTSCSASSQVPPPLNSCFQTATAAQLGAGQAAHGDSCTAKCSISSGGREAAEESEEESDVDEGSFQPPRI